MSVLITLGSFALVLGVLVFVHELGHFLAAKRVGIRVERFFLGFNPTIFGFSTTLISRKFGDTEYGIGMVPLGGYVKMAGEMAGEVGELPPTGDPAEFLSKTRWQRFQVLVAGPTMNLLLAFVLAAVVLYQGAEVESYDDQPVTVGVVKADSPAARAGIVTGDRIVSVGGHRVDTWEEFAIQVQLHANRATDVVLLRQGLDVTKSLTPEPADKTHFEIGVGALPNVHPHLLSVNHGEPGEKAGLRPGDVVVAFDGEPITFEAELRQAIAKSANKQITLSILRGSMPMTITVTPRLDGTRGLLGVLLADDTKTIKPSILGALKLSAQKNWQMTGMIGQTMWGLLTRQLSPKQLMGPIAIAQASGEAAKFGGVMALAALMVSLSLNLGLLNLMPIPMLDGGHILIMALEGIARRDFSVRVKERVFFAGFVVLMMLMVTVFYNDLARLSVFERLNPWK